ncbi:hypothetical protein Tco_0026471 [Tanacetum coccineum]
MYVFRWYGYVKYHKKISQKRTRERMSDQEAKEIKAEARKIMPQPSTVWISQISQEISQKRTRERMSDQEAKDLKAKAREIMPQPSTVNCKKPQLVTNMELDGGYGNKGCSAEGQLIS